MDLEQRIQTFIRLGEIIPNLIKSESGNPPESNGEITIPFSSNEWYTSSNVIFALDSISVQLNVETIQTWLKDYPKLKSFTKTKTIGLVTAGNIPLVGFHDVLCILLSGHRLLIKHSSKDEKLMGWILQQIIEINPDYKDLIVVESNYLKNFDAVIATGSDNSSRYFEYYFGKYPNIIRKNRNSIAILTGDETDEELQLLADDMLLYFGLGCRNVSKLYIPEKFDIQRIFKSVYKYHKLIDHNKYGNNYTYNKSIYLMNRDPFLENGFLILKEDDGMSSPISVVFHQRYDDINILKKRIDAEKDKIQCVVTKHPAFADKVYFGEAQKPKLWDFADNLDTMNFLLSLE
jgi:hypothetical protein